MKKSTKRILYIVGVIIGLLLILRLTGVIKPKSQGLSVSVTEIGTRDIIQYVSATGKANAIDEVSVSSDVSGEITHLYVQEGQYVRQGELLATIRAENYKAAVDQSRAILNQNIANVNSSKSQVNVAKANYDKAKIDYDRYKKLLDDKVISLSEFQTYQTAYLTAKANLKTAQQNVQVGREQVNSSRSSLQQSEENLQKTSIRAPRSGVITMLNVEAGEKVVGTATMAGTEMMRISDMDQMEVRATIGENDVVKIKTGDSVSIELEAYTDKMLQGHVTRISNSTGTGASLTSTDQAATYTVYILIEPMSIRALSGEGGGNPIRPGMSAMAKIYTRKVSDVLAAPFNSVTTRDDTSNAAAGKQECVFVTSADGKEALIRFVKTGIQDDKYIQIVSGLKKGEKVIDAPYTAISKLLENKKHIKVVTKEELYEEE